MRDKNFHDILVFVAGETPQVITETIYALSQRRDPVYPEKIYVITTASGRRCVEDALIRRGILRELIDHYNLPPIELGDDSFVIPKDSKGDELEDIRTASATASMGDLITSFIREKAEDFSLRLNCSITGGRKTMSFYLGSALQLFARPWDKLYHVLVSPAFEANPHFFFKPREDMLITYRSKNGEIIELNTRDAEIELTELPFIRLREKLFLKGKNFNELVSEGQLEIDIAIPQHELTVNRKERAIKIGDASIYVTPVQLMTYITFLRQKTDNCELAKRSFCFNCTECFKTLVELSCKECLEVMAGDYKMIYSDHPYKASELIARWSEGLGIETIRQNISKINRSIREQYDNSSLIPYYLITSLRRYGSSRYGITLEKSKIRIL